MTNKVIYISLLEGKPILSSDTFNGLKDAMDEYCGVSTKQKPDAVFLGYVPYESKYPDELEGYFEYEFTDSSAISPTTCKEKYHVYCIDFHVTTKFLRRL